MTPMGRRTSTGHGSRKARLAGILGSFLALAWASGCGIMPPREPGPSGETQARDAKPRKAAEQPAPVGRFQEPGELDRLVDAKPINFPAVKTAAPAASAAPAKGLPEAYTGKGRFRIQVGAENDIDAAQSKKAEYERKLGGAVDVVFDPPYYKLRWGFFETKQEADDKILEIADLNIQGFVVKQ